LIKLERDLKPVAVNVGVSGKAIQLPALPLNPQIHRVRSPMPRAKVCWGILQGTYSMAERPDLIAKTQKY